MKINFQWYFSLAFKYLFPYKKRFSFLSVIAIFGVSLGVMILFVVNSVMEGFQREICSKISDSQGEIRIDSDQIIENSYDVYENLKSYDDILAISSYVMGFVMLQFEERQAFPLAKGIDISSERIVVPLDKFIISGNLDDLDNHSIIISSELAKALKIKVGDYVDIYSPLILQNLENDELILPKSYEVVAIYQSGWNYVDSNFVMLTKSSMQVLYGMQGNQCHGFCVKLKDNNKISDVVPKLKDQLYNLRVCSWQEMNEDFLFVLKLEKTMMMFVLLFILLVASFSISSSLLISVVKKRREIGLLYAFGACLHEVAFIFIFEGFIIGVLGSLIGLILGTIALFMRNHILSLLTKCVGIDNFLLKFYDFAELPVHYSFSGAAIIVTFSIIVCCLAGAIPALVASKIKPADALRNE